MLKGYFLLMLRNLYAHKFVSIVNVLGLTIGLTCCMFILMFVQYERSYDKQFTDHSRIFRVERTYLGGAGQGIGLAPVAGPVGPLLKQEFSEIESFVRIKRQTLSFSNGDTRTRETHIGLVDETIFDFFDLRMIAGDAATALDQPLSVVMSESSAKRYFGSSEAVGKELLVEGKYQVTVKGVFRDLPENTHLKLDMLVPLKVISAILGPKALEDWDSNNYYTYIKIPENYNPEGLESRLPGFIEKHLGPQSSQDNRLSLRSLTDIHLYSKMDNEFRENGDIRSVVSFLGVGLLVLLIACFNFMNLSTARFSLRAKEIGVRKTVGARVSQLIIQFLIESTITAALAMCISLVVVFLGLPMFEGFLNREISRVVDIGQVLAIAVVLTIVVGVFSGSYPALYLSRFRPIDVLKGKISEASSAILTRKALVVFQFSISICLAIITVNIFDQMKEIANTDLGIERDNNIIVTLPPSVGILESYNSFRDRLISHPQVKSVAISSYVPSDMLLDGASYSLGQHAQSKENQVGIRDLRISYNFLDHFGIKLIAGRAFQESDSGQQSMLNNDTGSPASIILNKSAVEALQIKDVQDAIGKDIARDGRAVTIIGVVEDVYFSSLRTARRPMAYALIEDGDRGVVSVKYTGDPSLIYRYVQDAWLQVNPIAVAKFEFLDSRFDDMYRNESQQEKLLTVFSLLAITIAVMGLLGLVSFSTERRRKEIAVRKVVGARVLDIVVLITKEFSILIIIANVIAWPIAFWLLNRWLGGFVHVTSLKFTLFLLTGAAAFFIAWAVIALQVGRVAANRPVFALRHE